MTSLNQKLMKNSLFLTSNLFCGQKWNKSVVIKKWGKVGAYPSHASLPRERFASDLSADDGVEV